MSARPFLQLDHLNLSVLSFADTAAWYGRVFGFRIVERDVLEDGTPWGVLRAGDALLCVYEHPDFRRPTDSEREQRRELGLNHLGLRIRDRAAWERTVAALELPVRYGGEFRWPHSSAWYVVDPNGYEIEVVLWDDDEIRFDARPTAAAH